MTLGLNSDLFSTRAPNNHIILGHKKHAKVAVTTFTLCHCLDHISDILT